MAPKKQKGGGKALSKSNPPTVDSRPAPKLQISAENERRLRRLLLNTERPSPAVAAADSPAVTSNSVTRAQKTRRIRGVYDKLSLEGFTSDQIEQALSALKEGATFENALDWLCLNIPGNELPLKFSSGTASSTNEDRSVRIITTARADWVPTQHPRDELKEGTFELSVRFKGQRDESSLDLGKSSQAVWIRQYLEQEEEDEDEEKEYEDKENEKEVDPCFRADSVAKEYRLARLGALEAKQNKNMMNQKKYTEIIGKLKQKLTSLGLSEKDLESELQDEIASLRVQEMPCCSPETPSLEPKPSDEDKFEGEIVSASIVGSSHFEELNRIVGSSVHSVPVECQQKEEPEELELEVDPCSRADSVAKEYRLAKMGALEANQKRNKTSQKKYNDIIRKLKPELKSLGLSEKDLESELHYEIARLRMQEMPSGSPEDPLLESKPSDDAKLEGETASAATVGSSHLEELNRFVGRSIHSIPDECEQKEEPEELELDNLFSEDCSYNGTLPSEALKQQKKKKFVHSEYSHILGNIDEIWKKCDTAKIPKAVLQKLCQRLGWEAPKYNRVSTIENKFVYSVSILRTASGRGKSRKTGGLINFQYPNQDEAFRSTEEAQNKIAAFVLYQLFPNLPFAHLLIEPYASFIRERLAEDDFSERVEDTENNRRVRFVDSLLDGVSKPRASKDVKDESVSTEILVDPPNKDGEHNFLFENTKKKSLEGLSYHEQRESKLLKEELQNKLKNPKYMAMLETRAALPIAKLQHNLLQLFSDNDVIIVSGETGSGKTTQIPQFILDDMIKQGLGGVCNIICTQPRRIAAMSVAERVSDERCESSPGGDGSLVGYQVRLDSVRNERTKLLFCTTGILLRKLASNRDLVGVTHVIVDEVHERSLLGDFLLIVLKNIIKRQSSCSRRRSNLKVILMSATFDSSLFSKYFGHCPVITAEGRTHPVSVSYIEDIYEKLEYNLPSDSNVSGVALKSNRGRRTRKNSVDNHRGKKNLVMSSWGDETLLDEDYVNPYYISDLYHPYSERTQQNLKHLNEDVIDFELLEDLIYHIDETCPPGAILVFLPGVPEIELVNKLAASFQFRGMSSDWVLPLHSSLSSMEQRKVFLSPPENTRKVIIATDIAETSITIDDVIYVVDSGKHKESRFNPHKKMSSMVEEWISRANAKQRRGRAGRVKPGICFCLYTLHRFEKLMRPFQVPEMLRMPLTDLCLQIKFLSLGDIKSFLLEAIEPPGEDAICSAVDLLYKVGAFEGCEELSPLGYHLAKLPVDVLIGKMILHGAIFGCLSPVLSIAAFLSHKSPFLKPKDEIYNVMTARSTLLTYGLDGATAFDESKKQSDHLLLVIAYNRWARILNENGSNAAQQFCRSFFLNSSVMHTIRDMRIQFGSLLADIGLITLPRSFQINCKRKDKLESWLADMKQPFNIHAMHSAVIKSILCAGLYPNVAAAIEGTIGLPLGSNTTPSNSMSTADRSLWFDGKREVHIHPSSLNHGIKDSEYPFLVFLEKVETSKVFLRDTSIISPYSLLLFGGSISVQHQIGVVIIDGWLKLTAPAQTAVLFKELRSTLHAVLNDLIRKPEVMTVSNNEVVKTIINLLLEEKASHCS